MRWKSTYEGDLPRNKFCAGSLTSDTCAVSIHLRNIILYANNLLYTIIGYLVHLLGVCLVLIHRVKERVLGG